MNIEELPALLKKLEDRAGEQEAIRSMVLEIGTTLADLMALLEKSGPETAKAIASGLKEIKVSAAAPQVKVDSPVTVNVPPAPAPVVHVVEKENKPHAGWKFDVELDPYGNFKSMTAKPL